MERPNILFLLGESHAPDLLAAAGHPVIKTPNLDRLIARGTRFSNAYCASPLCVPARAALATGHFPHETGYWDSSMAYDGRYPSWMGRLREHGYQTTGIGKMHFRSDKDDVGFTTTSETMHIAEGIGDLVSALRCEGREPSYKGLWEIWTSRYGHGEDNQYRAYDERITAEAETWLANAPKNNPWALCVHFIAAHAPFVTPGAFYNLYKPDDIPLPVRFFPEERPDHPSVAHLRQIVPHDLQLPLAHVQSIRAAYYATITYLDSLLGRILNTLEATDQAENTLIIYTSDHGFSIGDHYIFGLFHLYEESLGVPLIMAGPSVPENQTIQNAVSHVDLFPTILETGRIKQGGADKRNLSRSLLPLLCDPKIDHEPVFAEYHGTGTRTGGYMLRYGKYKLIHFLDMPPQLFDLDSDPLEAENLAQKSAYSNVLANMLSLLLDRVDPVAVDRRAKADQAALIERFGGAESVLQKMGGFSYSPPPGVRWQDMEGNEG